MIIRRESQNKNNDSQKISKMSHVSSTLLMTSIEEPHWWSYVWQSKTITENRKRLKKNRSLM